jgi:hypothetical protein
MKIEVTAVIRCFDVLEKPHEDVLARLGRASMESIVNISTVQRWISKFHNGKTVIDDETRPGQHQRDENLPVIRTISEDNPYPL